MPFEGISLLPLVFSLVLYVTSFSPPHGFAFIDELKSTGIVFYQSKTLVEVQVVISVIPVTKVVVHGIIIGKLGISGFYWVIGSNWVITG